MANLKETPYAPASKAEVSKIATGDAPESRRFETTPRRGLPQVQEPTDGASRVSGVRDVPGPGSDAAGVPGTRQLGPTASPQFLTFGDTVATDRAFVFPGQGAQFVGMGKDLYEQFASARELYDRADDILGFGLSKICFDGPEEALQQTRNTQPAIAVTSLALLKVATEVSPALLERPAFVAGHSLGEYAALVASGSLGFETAIRLLRARGELMQQAGERNPGTMAAILGLDLSDCEEVCQESGAEVCNVNAPGQVVIGGRREAVVRALDYAKARGAAKVIPLSVSGAFHSSLMRPAADGMVHQIATASIDVAPIPVIANCSASPITDELSIRNELVDQVCSPVRWSSTVDYLGEQGVTTFIEFGPGRVLTGIIKRMLRKSNCANVNDAASVAVSL